MPLAEPGTTARDGMAPPAIEVKSMPAPVSTYSAPGPGTSDPSQELKLIFLDIDGVICCNGMGR